MLTWSPLFGKLVWIRGVEEGLDDHASGGLMMTVTARRVVISDDDVGTQPPDVEHHAAQQFRLTPGAKRLFGRFRETKVTETEEVRFRALYFGRGHRLTRANDAEVFVEFGTDGVLSAFAEGRKQRDCVHAILSAQNSQECCRLHHRDGRRHTSPSRDS